MTHWDIRGWNTRDWRRPQPGGLPAFRQAAPQAFLLDLGAVRIPVRRTGGEACAALSPLQHTTPEAARNDGAHGNAAEGLDEDDRGTGGHTLVGEVEDP